MSGDPVRLIVNALVSQPTLLQALRGVPSTRVIFEQLETVDYEKRVGTFWVESDDCDAFEAAMKTDPTVTDIRCLTTFSDQQLYRVKQVGEGQRRSVYPTLVDAGGVLQRMVGTHEGWEYQVAFPNYDGLTRFRDVCAEYDLQFTLLEKYEQAEYLDVISGSADSDIVADFGLTPVQRETLTKAVEEGYYAVPREIKLAELATQMEVSDQAVTERLRRAIVTFTTNAFLEPTSEA
ncbi:helix-turn-helix domain-containing protein [Halomarina salina]|uniref:Helix-turn-helix domain-containing protein n=1 Tax=Halomarina salina TaxID=1872699 RepID=A0ABD5RQB6_9EURY|nr:helix-turn-helix domain-containing protein [Halomarina salina]